MERFGVLILIVDFRGSFAYWFIGLSGGQVGVRTSKQLVELGFICGKWNLFMGEVLFPIYTSSEMLCSCCTK